MDRLKDFTIITPRPCTSEDILLCHSEGLLLLEQREHERYEVARLAAGGAIKAAKLALKGFIPFGVIRPPGHHANPDHNWGFCIFNNMAIAIKRLKADREITRAVILDIDLHFGDGTDSIFEYDRDVSVLNIQAASPERFFEEMDSQLDQIASADIIGVSAGFDQYIKDWGCNLSTDDFKRIGQIAGNFARERTRGRIFGILEGGYYIPDLGRNLYAFLAGLVKGLS